MKRRHRVGLAILLLAAIAALLVAHAATADGRWPYPTGEDLKSDYEAHVGEETLLFAVVQQVEPGRMLVESEMVSYRVDLPADGRIPDVRPGGIVQVYGTIAPDGIDAQRVVVVSATTGAERRKLLLSVVGALLFLVLFFRYWRVNPRHLRVEVRDGG